MPRDEDYELDLEAVLDELSVDRVFTNREQSSLDISNISPVDRIPLELLWKNLEVI